MEIRLEKLEYEIGNLSIDSNNVNAYVDYDEVGDNIQMTINSYIGFDEYENYRFSIKSRFLFTELPNNFTIEECIDELVREKFHEIILFFENIGNAK